MIERDKKKDINDAAKMTRLARGRGERK